MTDAEFLDWCEAQLVAATLTNEEYVDIGIDNKKRLWNLSMYCVAPGIPYTSMMNRGALKERIARARHDRLRIS